MPNTDLTHPLSSATWTYPGDPPVRVESHASIDADGYRVASLALGTHAGTHVDAPSHTEPDGATVASLPVESFEFEAILARVDADGDTAIDPDDLPPIPAAVDCVVIATGWATHWGTDRYLGHPFLSETAATQLADRGLSVGIDTPSVDPPGDDRLLAHHALLGAGRRIIENLTGLGDLPERFQLRAYPLPIVDGDGSPVRAVAAH